MSIESFTLRLYRSIASAFPSQFHEVCGPEMEAAGMDLLRTEVARRGAGALFFTVPRLMVDLIYALVVEHLRDGVRDARYGVRLLMRSPGFTAAAVLCLALGIGVTAAMYSQIQSTVFRAIPGVREPAGLVRFQRPVSFDTYQSFRSHTTHLSSAAAFIAPVPLVLSRHGAAPVRLWAHIVTPEYFEVLGARAALGRVFGSDEQSENGAPVAVISDGLWRSRFGADAAALGSGIRINGAQVEIIGVAEPGFVGASPTTALADMWIPTTAPVRLAPELATVSDRRAAIFNVLARLAPGVTYSQAELALEPVARRLERISGDPNQDREEPRVRLLPGGRMFPVRDQDVPKAVGFPLLLVGLVLLMACGNVANMLLARSIGRRREIAVRLSLGAGPGRIVRQLMMESLVLSSLGGVGGTLFAFWFSSMIAATRPMIPDFVHFESRPQWQFLGAAVLAGVAVSFLFGLVPALRASRGEIYAGLKARSTAGSGGRGWFSMRNLLVFQQVAVSMVLLLLTAFVVVGWQRSANVSVGFDPTNLFMANVDPVRDGLAPNSAADVIQKVSERLRNTPGIQSVAVAQTLPLALSTGEMMMNSKVEFAGGARSVGAIRTERVGAGFFSTIGTRLRSGREFTLRDERENSRFVVVNQEMATRSWPNANAVGQTVDLEQERCEVIGVVDDIRSAFPLAPVQPAVFRPAAPAGLRQPGLHGVTLLMRVTPGFDAGSTLRQIIPSIHPSVTVFGVRPVSVEIDRTLYFTRFATFVYGGMGAFGLLLACVGLAGVTAYAVARRTNEIGIRIALGAAPWDVLKTVLREASAIVLGGTIVGMAMAVAALRALAAFVDALAEATRMSTSDPLLLIGAPALLAAVALLACYVPARRAMRIDPAAALRAD